jgi:DNA-binding SARP family transcriptional activator
MPAPLEFCILGPLEARRDGRPVSITAPKLRALLSLLLLRANEPVSQDELINELWDGDPPSTARASLQNQIHALRKFLGPQVLERRPVGYVLHVEADHLDLQRFRRLAAEARGGEARERATKLRDAMACWRGPALVDVRGAAFAQTEIGRIEEERLTALEERIDADLNVGRHVELVPELEQLVADHPLRERFWAQLMLALYRSGRQADALAAYRRAHQRFSLELGIEPGIVLRELQRNILVQDPALDDPSDQLGSTLERAAALLPRGPREQAQSLFEYGSALMRIGERRQAAATLDAAIRAAVAAREPVLEQRARLTLSHLSMFTEGRTGEEHLATVVGATEVFERAGDDAGLAHACWHRANLLWTRGNASEGAEWARRGIELAMRAGDRFLEATCRDRLARCLAAGAAPIEGAIRACEKQLEADCWGVEGRFGVLGALALLHAHANRPAKARALVEEQFGLIRAVGTRWNLVAATFWAGVVERATGDLEAAATRFRAACTMLEAEDDRSFLADAAGALACVLALRGQTEDARARAQVARRLAQADDVGVQIVWRRAYALVAARDGAAEEACRLSDEALDLTRGSEVLAAHGEALEEAATVRELAGNGEGAREALVEALEAYEQKGSIAGARRVSMRLATK